MPMDYVMEASSRAHFSGLRLADDLMVPTSPTIPSSATAASITSTPFASSAPTPPPLPITNDDHRQPFVIGVTGGTASGKTTVCDMIIQQLHDHRVVLVNQDSFYRGLTAEQSARAHEYNFDHPDAFDTEQLLECIGQLKHGLSVNVPIYDFKHHQRSSESYRKVALGETCGSCAHHPSRGGRVGGGCRFVDLSRPCLQCTFCTRTSQKEDCCRDKHGKPMTKVNVNTKDPSISAQHPLPQLISQYPSYKLTSTLLQQLKAMNPRSTSSYRETSSYTGFGP